MPEEWKVQGAPFANNRTDAGGKFLSRGIVPWTENVRVIVRHPGYAALISEIGPVGGPGEVMRVPFVLQHKTPETGRTISGRVFLNDLPAEGLVRWEQGDKSGQAKLNSGGEYRLSNLPRGLITLIPCPSYQSVDLGPIVGRNASRVCLDGDAVQRYDFGVQVTFGRIGGRVLTSAGVGVAGTPVDVDYDRRFCTAARTGSGGEFSFLLPTGTAPYTLTTEHGEETLELSAVTGEENLEFVLADLELVWLRVLDATTREPTSTLKVFWKRAEEGIYRGVSLRGSADDGLALELPVGMTDLLVHAHGYVPRSHRFAVGPVKQVDLELSRGHTLELALADEAQPWPEGHVIFVVEPAFWGEISSGGRASGAAATLFPGMTFAWQRLVRLNEPTSISGLSKGVYRLWCVPDDISLEPAQVEVVGEQRLELLWSVR